MQPALNPDANTSDYVFLSRWAIKNYSVERGSVVALISPKGNVITELINTFI